jgi:hypothetical protein
MLKNRTKNGYSQQINGWKYVSIQGTPRERGIAYGELCANDFKEIQEMLKFNMYENYGREWDYFVKEINHDLKEKTKKDFHELYEEMEGIVEGCLKKNVHTTLEEIIAWNFYCSIPYWYQTRWEGSGAREGGSALAKGGALAKTGSPDKCSAFIAVGDYTEDGKIVVAHNSFSDFIDGQYANIVLHVTPSKGHTFIMQTSP